jgi:hypothetical protein
MSASFEELQMPQMPLSDRCQDGYIDSGDNK